MRKLALMIFTGLLGFWPSLPGAQEAPATQPADAASTITAAASEEKETVRFAVPVFVTDIGQGNNARLIEVMLRRDGTVEFKAEPLANAEEALKDTKTLVLGVGASTKGLGAAGLNADQEMQRTRALVAAAREQKIPVIGVHIGGMPRRGELSDVFVEATYRASNAFIVWTGGNEDGYFDRLATETGIRTILVEGKIDVGTVLVDLLTTGDSETGRTLPGPDS